MVTHGYTPHGYAVIYAGLIHYAVVCIGYAVAGAGGCVLG
jgi:hypothetical protein